MSQGLPYYRVPVFNVAFDELSSARAISSGNLTATLWSMFFIVWFLLLFKINTTRIERSHSFTGFIKFWTFFAYSIYCHAKPSYFKLAVLGDCSPALPEFIFLCRDWPLPAGYAGYKAPGLAALYSSAILQNLNFAKNIFHFFYFLIIDGILFTINSDTCMICTIGKC